ncbi:hypothetical protein [Azospirillum brasilense]|uniref:hypothetical protein n=1 Tax=Azospirillum brasilense TaxID=192 RepID=UPI0010C147E3|nr:hypothetical protein [Azospirillum brasilense]MBK3736149.1 hypothetical protein [Azospirillum brasilense]MDW7553931.1 hypothetical protein [Azospirillum brasilense]
MPRDWIKRKIFQEVGRDGWVVGFVTENRRPSGYSRARSQTPYEMKMAGPMLKLLLALLPLGASLLMLATVQ